MEMEMEMEKEINLQIKARNLVSREVYASVSTLVSGLIKASFNTDLGNYFYSDIGGELEHLTTDREEWEEPVREYIDGLDQGELQDVAEFVGVSEETLAGDLEERVLQEIAAEDSWSDVADRYGVDPHYREVFEYWAVSGWLGEQLAQRGEVVGDLADLTIWGRCTTGQAIAMDYVIQQIVEET